MKAWVLSFILLVTLPAWAQNFSLKQTRYQLSYQRTDKVQTLRFTGSLQLSGDESALTLLKPLRERLERDLDIKLVLDLFGGELSFVNRIYDVIKGKCNDRGYRTCRITTEVEMFRHCISACVPLFMVGDQRIAAERSNWGFHQAHLLGGFLMIPFMAEHVLKQKKVSPVWLKKNKAMFKQVKITYLEPHEMKGSNIITKIVPHPL